MAKLSAAVVPRLTREGYSTRPSLEALGDYEESDLANVQDFAVVNEVLGEIEWPGFTDVRGLDLDLIVNIDALAVEVYGEAYEERCGKGPEVGEGLNKPAVVSLYNCKPKEVKIPHSEISLAFPKIYQKHLKRIKLYTEKIGAKFISLSENWTWKFRVEHFSRYAYVDSSSSSEDELTPNASIPPTSSSSIIPPSGMVPLVSTADNSDVLVTDSHKWSKMPYSENPEDAGYRHVASLMRGKRLRRRSSLFGNSTLSGRVEIHAEGEGVIGGGVNGSQQRLRRRFEDSRSSGVHHLPSSRGSGVHHLPSSRSSGVHHLPSSRGSGVHHLPSSRGSGVYPLVSQGGKNLILFTDPAASKSTLLSIGSIAPQRHHGGGSGGSVCCPSDHQKMERLHTSHISAVMEVVFDDEISSLDANDYSKFRIDRYVRSR